MNSRLILFLSFLALSTFSSGQILVGPTGGVNFSWTSFENRDSKDTFKLRPMPGFFAGVNVSFKVRNRFFLHTSVLYSQKGKDVRGKLDPYYHNKARANFIEVPVT